jgi:hypothetical protein
VRFLGQEFDLRGASASQRTDTKIRQDTARRIAANIAKLPELLESVQTSAFLPLPLLPSCRQRGVSALLQRQLDALDEKIMDFESFVEGDLP